MPIWLAGASCDKIEEYAISLLNVPWKQLEIDSNAPIEVIGKYVDEECPVVYSVDSSCIIDKRRNKWVPKENIKIVSLSLVTVIGYDKKKASILLDLKDTEFVETSLEKFQKARFSRCFPKCPEGRCYDASMSVEYMKWFEENFRSLLVSGVLATCEKMLNGYIRMNPETGRQEYAEGLEGIHFMIQTLKDFKRAVEESEVDKEVVKRILKLEITTLRDMLLPGSDTCYREEFGQGLLAYAKLTSQEEISEIGSEFIALGTMWRDYVRKLSTVQYHLEDIATYLSVLIEKTELLYYREKQGYTRLMELMR